MILLKCVVAQTALNTLMEQEMSYKTAHALVVLKKKLAPHIEFFSKEEMKLANEYGKKDENGNLIFGDNNTFKAESTEGLREYMEKRNELGMVEVEIEGDVVTVPPPAKIKPVQVEALDGFINFKEGD